MTNLREASARLVECLREPGRMKRGETLMRLADKVDEAVSGEIKQGARLKELNGSFGAGLIVIHRIRGGGKTTELIDRVRKENGVLLVKYKHLAESIIYLKQLKKDQVLTWEQARDPLGPLGRGMIDRKRPIYVDDAEHIIHDHFRYRIAGVSIS